MVSRQMMTLVAGYAQILDSDLTGPQYYVLQTLANEGDQTSSYFASVLNVTLPSVTNLSNKLVSKGLIERVTSEADRRQVYLRITERGREMEARMVEKYRELNEGLWSDYTEEELDLLISAYAKMIDHFQLKINPSGNRDGK
ncbi:MarR family winged helix-turn-helix transcriptional regulator [Paenibacillus ihbetae]|uniref:MarR family transcriptional regulator n=1 Tax=Paenibacillus ihbetae TaxID=1870820 RepID=A0A1B2E1L3_9BACL|nr:MarR family transcriptional regulator [Paenibacillus ihbetae]ANY73878.1 MarR family transcriptional regulator [Paenibacillus ihbetae]OOC63939.1 MarR family transcriptional regulator [Paenibacillus ihbetae]